MEVYASRIWGKKKKKRKKLSRKSFFHSCILFPFVFSFYVYSFPWFFFSVFFFRRLFLFSTHLPSFAIFSLSSYLVAKSRFLVLQKSENYNLTGTFQKFGTSGAWKLIKSYLIENKFWGGFKAENFKYKVQTV